MPYKVSILYDYNSTPTDLRRAAVHKGGWSETVWSNFGTAPDIEINFLAGLRSAFLPSSVRIIGRECNPMHWSAAA